jgi:iron(III) transport system permease protein
MGISAALLWVVGIPIIFVLVFSFLDGNPVLPGSFTLDNYTRAYGNPRTYSALGYTLIYATVVTLVSLSMATLFAWLIERTDMPGRNWAWVMMLLPIAMPGMLASMAWILLLSPKVGLVNIVIRGILGLVGIHMESGPLNVYSLWGMIFVEGVRGSTTLFLMMVAAFRLMDPAMEEAATISGASSWYTFRKVTLRLLTPAILAGGMYAFIGNLDDLETPLLIGLPAGIFLLPTLIYFTASQSSDWGLSSAYTVLFLTVTVSMVVFYYRVVVRKAGQFATITGKAYRPRRHRLGKWRWPALGVFFLYFTFAVLMPTFILVWASLLPQYRVPSTEALANLSFDNYVEMAGSSRILSSAFNTLELGLWTATATMVLAFLVAWLVVRQRVKGGVGLDMVAFIPRAIPSVAIGVSLIIFYLNPAIRWLPVYGTMAIMVLALMAGYMAFASRSANSAMTQLNAELEEAAYVSGVGKVRTLARITFRLLSPAFIAGWIWVFAHTLRNLSVPLLLATSDNQTIATTLYYYWSRKADFSLTAALGVTLLVVLMIVAFIGRRFVASGFSKES